MTERLPEEDASSTGRPLRVTMFTPWRDHCGVSDYARLLIPELEGLNGVSEVAIVEPPVALAAKRVGERLRTRRSERAEFRRLGEQMNGLASLADVTHIQHQYFFFGGVAPHKSRISDFWAGVRIPAVMTVHEIAVEDGSGLRRTLIGLANRRNLLDRAVRRWIVHTAQDREALVRIGAPEARVHVVPHGVPQPTALADTAMAREELGLGERRVVTLFGFLSSKKGHRVAIEAAQHLPDDVIILFAGGRHPDDRSDYAEELKREVARLGLASRIRVTGYLPAEEIPKVMAVTEAAIAPYLNTSGSGSLANLMAYGEACIVSDIGPHREIESSHPGSLLLTPVGDGPALAAAISAVLDDPALRRRLAAHAREYALQHSYRSVAQATLEVYQLAIADASGLHAHRN